MARGEVSAARTISSAVPRLSVLVAVEVSQLWVEVLGRGTINCALEEGDNSEGKEEILFTFIGALFQLAIIRSLLDNVEDLLRKGFIGNRPC